MPTYTVTDPASGRTLTLTGDSPPTEQELEDIFAQAGGGTAKPADPYANDSAWDFSGERTLGGRILEGNKGVARGFANTILSSVEGAAELADAATNFVGLDNLIDSGDENAAVSVANAGRDWINKESGVKIDPRYQDLWTTKVGEGIGSVASLFTPSLFLKGASALNRGRTALEGAESLGKMTRAEKIATGAFAASTGAGEAAQRAKATREEGLDVTEGQEDFATAAGAIVGLSEMLPISRILGRVPKNIPRGEKDYLINLFKSAGIAAAEEGGQEVSAAILQNMIERGYNPNQEIIEDSLIDDLTVGGAVGALADITLNAFAGRRKGYMSEAQIENERKAREIESRNDFQFRQEMAERKRISELVQSDPDTFNAEAERVQGSASTIPAPTNEEVMAFNQPSIAGAVATPDTLGELYSLRIVGKLGNFFPTNTSFTVEQGEDVPTPVVAPDGTETVVPQPAFKVVDSTGKQYGQTLNNPEVASSLARNLNGEIVGQSIRGSILSTLMTSPQGYNPEQATNLFRYGYQTLNPESNNVTYVALNDAAGTTTENGYIEEVSHTDILNSPKKLFAPGKVGYEVTMPNGKKRIAVGLTASQELNRKREDAGLPSVNSFNIRQAREALGGNIGTLSNPSVTGIQDQLQYAPVDVGGKPAVMSQANEVLTKRKTTLAEKAKAGFKQDGTSVLPDYIEFQSIDDAKRYADSLNKRNADKRFIPDALFEGKKDLLPEIKTLLDAKNIDAKIDSPEVGQLVKSFTGARDAKSMSLEDQKLFYARLRNLPGFSTKTKLPVFRLRPYSPEQFVKATQYQQQNPGAVTDEGLATALGLEPTSPRIAAIKSDLQKQTDARLQKEVLKNSRLPLVEGLRKALDDYGLSGVNLRLEESLGRGPDGSINEGYFDRMMDEVALAIDGIDANFNSTDEQRLNYLKEVLSHEVVHALRALDLWTAKEWDILSQAASRTLRPQGSLGEGKTFLAYAQEMYSDMSADIQVEESVAELARAYIANKKLIGGKPRNLIERMIRLFQRLKAFVTNSGYQSFEAILNDMRSGAIASRDRSEIRSLRLTKNVPEGYVVADDVPEGVETRTISDFDEAALEGADIRESRKNDSIKTIPNKLESNGFVRLEKENPRRYKNYATFERDGVRISLSSHVLEFDGRDVVKYSPDNGEMTIEAILVDPDKRGTGKAKEALKLVTDVADELGRTLYIEPAPLENDSGLNKAQLISLYQSTGFTATDSSSRVMIREPKEKNDRLRYSRKPMESSKDWAYSPLMKAVEQASPKITTAKQWDQWLDANASKLGVTRDEIDFSGIKDFLALKEGKVSKEDINGYLDNNGVVVKDVMKQSSEEAMADFIDSYVKDESSGIKNGYSIVFPDGTMGVYSDDGIFFEGYTPEVMAEKLGIELPEQETKYEDYALPGGENYRELLLTLPDKQRLVSLEEVNAARAKISSQLAPLTQAEYDRLASLGEISEVPVDINKFKSTHFDEPNILAHIRMNDRTDADGNKVLFIEEIQSDWAQAGRKGIFTKGEDYGVPVGPFVTETKNWVALALKRILALAGNEGYNKVAFINGQQSAERYDLRKQIRKIDAKKNSAGRYLLDVEFKQKEGERYAKTDTVLAKDEKELAEYVGKELAQKIAKDLNPEINLNTLSVEQNEDFETFSVYNGDFKVSPNFSSLDDARDARDSLRAGIAKPTPPRGSKMYTGLDLATGGEGMLAFYDSIVPQVAKKVIEKVGGKSLSEINVDDIGIQTGIEITPEMATRIAAGQRLFSRKAIPGTSQALQGEPRVLFEVAPSPDNQARANAWNSMLKDDKVAITRKIGPMAVREVASIFDIPMSAFKQPILGQGLFEGVVNPNQILGIKSGKVTSEQAVQFATALGYVLEQKAMVVADRRMTSKQVSVVRIYTKGDPTSVADRLYGLIQEEVGGFGGYAAYKDHIDIMNFSSIKSEELARRFTELINEKAPDVNVTVRHAKIQSAYIEEKKYASSIYSGTGRTNRQGLERRLDSARSRIIQRLESEIARATGQPTATTGTGEVRFSRRVRGGSGVLQQPSRPYQKNGRAGKSLSGLPKQIDVDGRIVEFDAFNLAQKVAERYMRKAGLPYSPPTKYVRVDPAISARIAEEFGRMQHDPQNPLVLAAYRQMMAETAAQYREIMKTGLKVDFIKGDDPYGNPRNAILDIVENNHFWVFSTRDGFGSNENFSAENNPLLEETEFRTSNGEKMLANDLLRVVHDYFGHALPGVGFRADGEENAWRSHASMYSPLARRAMTSETRGQNSYVNFGPNGEFNRTASPADTIYADQKVGLLPEWVSTDTYEAGAVLPEPEQVAPEPRSQEALAEAVAKVAKDTERTPSTSVPLYGENASPEALYVALNPEMGAKFDLEDTIRYSRRGNEPQYPPNIQKLIDQTPAPANETMGQTLVKNLQMPSTKDFWDNIRQGLVFRGARLERQYRENPELAKLMADTSALALYQMTDHSRAMTQAAITGGIPVYENGGFKVVPFVYKGKTIERGLLEIMAPLHSKEHGNLERLAHRYAMAVRGERLNNEGKLTPIAPGELQALEAEIQKYRNPATGEPIIKEWFDMWQAYNSNIVKYLQKTGIIDDAGAQLWLKQADYIPFYREKADGTLMHPKVFGGLHTAGQFKAVGKSSEDLNVDMVTAIVNNIDTAIAMGMKNVAQQRIIRDQINLGLASVLKKGETVGNRNSVSFKIAGKRYTAIIEDPLIYESMLPANEIPMDGLFGTMFRFPANLLRELIIRDPGYMAANMFRDTLSSYVITGAEVVPLWGTAKGFAGDIDKLRKLGVIGGYDLRMDKNGVRDFYDKEAKKMGMVAGVNWLNPVMAAWDVLGRISERSEAATRLAVYEDILKRTGNEVEAQYQALSVMNYGRRGNNPLLRMITALVPFLNARIQGLDKLYQATTGRIGAKYKTDTSGKVIPEIQRRKNFARFLFRAGLITGITAMYYAMVSDDDEYENASPEIRDNYYIIPVMKGDTESGEPGLSVRLPIPFEIGIMFKVIPERLIAGIYGDDTSKDFKDSMKRALFSTLAMNPTPQAILPIGEAMVNKDLYTGRPIVPYYMENLLPEQQKTFYTNVVAEDIANKMGFSPMKVDHVLRGYGGTLGGYLMQAVDSMARENEMVLPSTEWYQKPFIKRFFATANQPGLQNKFYELKGDVDGITQTINRLNEEGRYDELATFYAKNGHMYEMRKDLNYLEKQITRLRDQRKIIEQMDIDPESKRQQIEQINMMISATLTSVPMYRKMAYDKE